MIVEWALPDQWKWQYLEDITSDARNSVVDGPFGSNLKTSDYVPSGVPVLQGKNITGNEFSWKEIRFISEKKAEELKRSSVRVGDFLVIKIGSIGYSAEIKSLNGYDRAIIPANMAKVTIEPTKILPDYFTHWLRTIDTKRHLLSVASKTAQPALSLGKIKKLPIPLPPLEEQHRIAAILDKADAIRRKRQQALTLADDFLRATFLDMFGDPVVNPKGWDVVPFGDLAEVRIGPFGSLLHKHDYVFGQTPIVNPSHIIEHQVQPDENFTVPEQKVSGLTSYIMKSGDLVIGRRGEIGRCAVVRPDQEGFICGTGSLFARMKSHSSAVFFQMQISRTRVRDQLEDQAVGVTMKNLNVTIMGQLPVISPPFELQSKFEMIQKKFIATLERQACLLKDHQDLFSAISQRAFQGHL